MDFTISLSYLRQDSLWAVVIRLENGSGSPAVLIKTRVASIFLVNPGMTDDRIEVNSQRSKEAFNQMKTGFAVGEPVRTKNSKIGPVSPVDNR